MQVQGFKGSGFRKESLKPLLRQAQDGKAAGQGQKEVAM
jgi:hypothetical protein